MIQRALFPKSTKFRRPRRELNRWNDPIRVWPLKDGSAKVVETTQIWGVKCGRSFKAIVMTATGECLISRHRKLKPAMASVIKAADPKPEKRKKVRR